MQDEGEEGSHTFVTMSRGVEEGATREGIPIASVAWCSHPFASFRLALGGEAAEAVQKALAVQRYSRILLHLSGRQNK